LLFSTSGFCYGANPSHSFSSSPLRWPCPCSPHSGSAGHARRFALHCFSRPRTVATERSRSSLGFTHHRARGAHLFRGTGISQKWYAPYGPYFMVPALLLVAFFGLRSAESRVALCGARAGDSFLLSTFGASRPFARSGSSPISQPVCLPPLGSPFDHFSGAHGQWLAESGPRPPPHPMRWLAPLILVAAVPACIVLSLLPLDSQRLWQLFAERTHSGSGWPACCAVSWILMATIIPSFSVDRIATTGTQPSTPLPLKCRGTASTKTVMALTRSRFSLSPRRAPARRANL